MTEQESKPIAPEQESDPKIVSEDKMDLRRRMWEEFCKHPKTQGMDRTKKREVFRQLLKSYPVQK